MSAVQELEKAIGKLGWLRGASPTGPWEANQRTVWADNDLILETPGYDPQPHTVDLVATLHRTIDAQIGILRAGVGGATDLDAGATPDEPHTTGYAIALARAINGTT